MSDKEEKSEESNESEDRSESEVRNQNLNQGQKVSFSTVLCVLMIVISILAVKYESKIYYSNTIRMIFIYIFH